ncbi:hypothetical protein [Streptodolium elevatio]|uniref:Uncharacterized protein n=1 Tax=Streptodolium elevatio TaxID=3157996 RepID=A0ABV3DWQ1_9ACTN
MKNPDATYADAAETCVVAGIGASPALHHLIHAHDWPRDLLDTTAPADTPGRPKPRRSRLELPTSAHAPGPAVRALLVDPQTQDELGPESLAEIAAHLWAADCQTCGRPLGTPPPALVVHDLPGIATASLHHDNCAPPTQGPIRTVLAPVHHHNSWTARTLLMPLMCGDVQEHHAAMIVNPGLEERGP